MDDECNCEFDPYDPEDYKASEEIEESRHYKCTCEYCGCVWWGLHRIHDGVQNPCPDCKRTPFDRPTPMQLLYGGRRYGTSIR